MKLRLGSLPLPLLALFLTILFFLESEGVRAQIPVDDGFIVPAYVENGDTIPLIRIPAVIVVRQRVFKNARDYRAYQRMVRNLKIVYPYAVKAREFLHEMDSTYLTMDSDFQRRIYSQRMEKELTRQFESQIRNLTFSQGRMLLKLIDRETGRTTYEIIRTFRGGVSAGFWQGIARVFGSNLKSKYDAEEEDRILEELIILYEHGQL